MKTHKSIYKYALGLLIAGSLVIVWMILAVGIIGDSDDLANLMYAGVLGIGIAGALMVRFKAAGMAATAFVMAKAIVIVLIVAIGLGRHMDGSTPPLVTFFILHVIFIVCFFGAGVLFLRAAHLQKLTRA